jgi:adenine phosphoribosyltransferase
MPSRKWLNYPRPGMGFPGALGSNTGAGTCRQLIDRFVNMLPENIEIIAGINQTGAMLAGATAMLSGAGFMGIRSVDALHPEIARSLAENYHVAEGLAVLRGLVVARKSVAIIDDVLMTGETAIAAARLLTSLGARVELALFVFEVEGKGGFAALEAEGIGVHSLQVLPQPPDPRRLDEALAFTAPYVHQPL